VTQSIQNFTAALTAPSTPAAGDFWYDLSTGILAIFINDGNTTQWVQVSPPGVASGVFPTTGDAKLTLKTVADSGWVMMDDGSIGDASSSASNRANPDTQNLFVLLWTNIANAWAPVSGGRGGSAIADFNAHKTLALPRSLGRSLAIAGAGSGLTSRPLGSNAGAETETPTITNMAAHAHGDSGHNHGYPTGSTGIDGGSTYTALTLTVPNVTPVTANASAAVTSSGSGAPLNILDPSSYWNVMVKL
jgi:microcystin-dependent protein